MNVNSIIKDAKEDGKNLVLRCHLDLYKLNAILMHSRTLPGDITDNKIRGVVELSPNGLAELVIENVSLFEKQTFNELFIIAGISFFEKYCKEWFAWGLKYSPTKLNLFAKKRITILEITKSKDIKQTIIKKIIDDINFQDSDICNKKFHEVFGFKIFENIKDKHKFKKYLNHRHIISHNSGYADITYIERCGMDENFVGNLVYVGDGELEDLYNLIYDKIFKIEKNISTIIYNELEKNIKKE